MKTSEVNDTTTSSLDENISLLAIEAANELDELAKGRDTSLVFVKRLGQLLRQSFRIDGDQHRENFVDSTTVAVVSQAFNEFTETPKISTVTELAALATEVVARLERPPDQSGIWNVQKVRDFCIALSRAASAYQQSIYDLRPSHPFRD